MNWFSAEAIISALGPWVLIGVVTLIFLETATVFGSVFPGDSLLFLLGLSIGTKVVQANIWFALLLLAAAAVAGSQTGFLFGRKVGRNYFLNRQGWILNAKTVQRTELFFSKYGRRAIILARFVPILRALVPMFAGISSISKSDYFKLNLIGGFAWASGITLLGLLLGNIAWVRANFEICVLSFVVLSSLPFPIELLRHWLKTRQTSN